MYVEWWDENLVKKHKTTPKLELLGFGNSQVKHQLISKKTFKIIHAISTGKLPYPGIFIAQTFANKQENTKNDKTWPFDQSSLPFFPSVRFKKRENQIAEDFGCLDNPFL